jgi:cytochrome c oxidase subunit II
MKLLGKILTLLLATISSSAYANAGAGHNWQTTFYEPATQIMEYTSWFHNDILMPIIVAITILVLVLLIMLVVKFREKKNPIPSKTTHHVPLEIAWTLIPVAILMFIAVYSIDLLKYQDHEPKADVTIKAVGYQWYWGYEYPKDGVAEYSAYMLCPVTEGGEQGFDKQCVKGLKTKGLQHKLATDYPVVVPVNKNIRILTTASDVIHAWTIPAFGVKKDAVPGRMNSLWFNAKTLGTFYGQCSELCGVNHAFMPIMVKVVPQNIYESWLKFAQSGDLDGGNKILADYEQNINPDSAQISMQDIKDKTNMTLTVDGKDMALADDMTQNKGTAK